MEPINQRTPIVDNYALFHQFIENSLPGGFKEIDPLSPLIMRLEELTEINDQFFLIFDLIQMKIVFTSQRSAKMTGIEPNDFDPSFFFKSMHPDDLNRNNFVRTTLFNLGHQFFIQNKGNILISSNSRFKDSSGEYIETLVQNYLFFTDIPYKTVFILKVLTDISWFKLFRPVSHFYIGNDPSFFRYPDKKLLLMGNIFTPGCLRSLN